MEEVAGRGRFVPELHRVDLAQLVEHAPHERDRRQEGVGRPQDEAAGGQAGRRDGVSPHDAAPGRPGRPPGGMGRQQREEGQPARILHGRRQAGHQPGGACVEEASVPPVAEREKGSERDEERERHVRGDPVRIADVQEIDRQESGRQDPDRAAIGEPAGAIEDGERGRAEQRRDQAPDHVEERRVPAKRAGHAAGEGPERQAIHPRHRVHVQAGPVEEPRVQVSLVEAHRPLDDPRLVGMVEVRQAVRRAPRPERQTEEQDEEKAETEASLRASRGGRAWKGRRGECERRARVPAGAAGDGGRPWHRRTR